MSLSDRAFGPFCDLSRTIVRLLVGSQRRRLDFYQLFLVSFWRPVTGVAVAINNELVVSGVATLVILPALIAIGERRLFPNSNPKEETP